MSKSTLTILGSSDAFSSGGAFHSSYLIRTDRETLLIDCGATTVVALKRLGLYPADVDRVLITHPHGDHIGGFPFFLLDLQFIKAKDQQVVVAGPPGLEDVVRSIAKSCYSTFANEAYSMPLMFEELRPGDQRTFGTFGIEVFEAYHLEAGQSLSYRIQVDDVTVAVTGDSGWHDAIPDLARGSDIFLCECSSMKAQIDTHMSYELLLKRRESLSTGRLLLTHLGPSVREKRSELELETVEDGMVIDLESL